jgi:RNA polymerase sigma factor (sigma-70 family)
VTGMITRMRHAAFERLYAEHAPSLFAFLVYRVGDRAVAEDVLADAFERVLRTRARFDRRRGSEKAWLYTIALNCLRDHARRRDAEARALSRMGAPAEGAADDSAIGLVESRDVVQSALAVLSDEEREVVSLRFGGDLTLPEVARAIGEPLTTAQGRLYRALGKLRDALT